MQELEGSEDVQGRIALKHIRDQYYTHVDIVKAAPFNIGKTGKYKGVGAHLFAIACKLSWDTGNEGYVEMISYWGVRFILICMMNTQWGTLPGGKCHRLFTYSSKETSGCQKYFHNLILKHNILV